MQTVKTALVVTFLLAVLYVVYTALNKPDLAGAPEGVGDPSQWSGPEVELPDFAAAAPEMGMGESAAASLPELPAFDPGAVTSGGSQYAPTADPYAGEISAPPLSTDSAAASNAPESNEFEVTAPAIPGYAPETPAPSSASPYETSPYSASPYSDSASEAGADEAAADATYRPVEPGSAIASEAAAESRTSLAEYRFKETWAATQRQLDDNKFARALATLTEMYREPDLTLEHRSQMLDMLDRLAGTVIYSTEHRLEPPYEVNRGETLEEIAQQFSVPSELLFNINRASVNEPDLLLPGTQLKVMRGPFRAEVKVDELDPARGEATLFLGRLYAGRFPVTFGEDTPTPGREYQVTERLAGKPYYRPSGPPVEAGADGNPYGSHWIGLNDAAVAIHGGGALPGQKDRRGSIRLTNRDASDVFGILSVGSVVKILP